jgi:hypothetical protein
MSERIERYKQELASARRYLHAVIDQVGDRWETQVYADGAAWNVRQLLVHISEADKGMTSQVMGYAEGREIVPPDFDINRYNRRVNDKLGHVTPEDALDTLEQSRATLLAWLDNADDALLDKEGRHATLVIIPIWKFLETMANHERTHAQDIARILDIQVESHA